MFVTDLSALPPSLRQKVHEVCTNEFTVQAQLAQIRQEKIAQFHRQNEGRAIDGVGAQEMAVDPFFINYFALHHQADFWQDRDFRDWLKKRHEIFRVRTGGTRLQVGYGTKSSGAAKRFSKSYGETKGQK